jgi:hypothetical protein
VAVVVGVSVLGGRPVPTVPSLTTPPIAAVTVPPTTRTSRPDPTPMTVATEVGFITYDRNGEIEVFFSSIDEVCPSGGAPDCAPIETAAPREGELPKEPPQTVVISPNDDKLVVIPPEDDGGKVIVVAVPTAPGTTPRPTPTASPTPTPTPVVTPSPTTTPTAIPVSPPPAVSPSPTIPPPSATPSATPSAEPSPSPTPTASGGPIEIASDVVVVGQAAAYSADGAWFAFSARPKDGSQGPDIYLWRVGDAEAVPVTTDHRSVFAGWLGGQALGSRAVAVVPQTPEASEAPAASPAASAPTSAAPASTEASGPPDASPSATPAPETRAETFLIDPATGAQTILTDAPFWRPSVDPTGTRAVYWDGTLVSNDGLEWEPGEGRLVLGAWPPLPSSAPSETPSASPSASVAPSESASAQPTGSASAPASAAPSGSEAPAESASPEPSGAPVVVVHDAAVADWDARWDVSGTRLAVWLADAADPTVGRLSLYIVDPATGSLTLDPNLASQPALPGFSIGENRVAWATPDGEASHVEVLAWTENGSGKVESAPGDEQVVVIR